MFKNRGWLFWLIVALVLIGIGVAVYFLFFNTDVVSRKLFNTGDRKSVV